MNFLLKNLELHIPEAALLVGERLFEEDKVLSLKELERNFWLAEVEDFEIEVQITPNKVRAATCECEVFKQKEICGHLAAVLFKLRRETADRKAQKATKRLRKALPRKLTTASIIDNITEEQLINFVKSYAKGNRQFSLALKARFAANVPMQNSRDKYTQLIESTISTHRLKNDLINYRGFQQLQKLGRELIGQSDDAFALENYSEGLTMLQCLIEKITPVIQKIKGDGSPLKEYVMGAFLRIEKLLILNLAPALKENIWNFCVSESSKLTYQINGFAIYFYKILEQLSDKPNKVVLLRQIVDNELVNTKLPHNFKANLLFIKLNLLEKEGKKSEADAFISKHVSNSDFALFVVQKTLEESKFSEAQQFAENALLNSVPTKIRQELEEALFQIYYQKNEPEKIVIFGKKRLMATKKVDYFKAIKEHTNKDWEEKLSEILAQINRLPFSMEKRDLLAEIYLEENQFDTLLKYMERLQSLDLLQKIDQFLLPKFRKEVHQFYQDFLGSYLENHIGRKPTAKVEKALHHLFEIGENKFANQLIKDLQNRFTGRHALMETLMQV